MQSLRMSFQLVLSNQAKLPKHVPVHVRIGMSINFLHQTDTTNGTLYQTKAVNTVVRVGLVLPGTLLATPMHVTMSLHDGSGEITVRGDRKQGSRRMCIRREREGAGHGGGEGVRT